MLTEFISAEQCANCRLCCNFHRSSAWESPSLHPELADRLRQMGIPLKKREERPGCSAETFELHFHSQNPEKSALCPLLGSEGCILPRKERPFECLIWPLRLMFSPEGIPSIALYNAGCPAVLLPKDREKLIQFAAGPLLPTLRRYAASFPSVIRPFHPNYTIIGELNSK